MLITSISLFMSPYIKQLRTLLESESGDSQALVSDIANNPLCEVTVDDNVPCLCITWKRYATSMQLRYVLEYALQLLQERALKKILCDDTLLPTIHTEDQGWIADNWIPRAITAGWRVGANKNPETFYGRQSLSNIRDNAPVELELRSFETLEEARQWLQNIEC